MSGNTIEIANHDAGALDEMAADEVFYRVKYNKLYKIVKLADGRTSIYILKSAKGGQSRATWVYDAPSCMLFNSNFMGSDFVKFDEALDWLVSKLNYDIAEARIDLARLENALAAIEVEE